MAYFLSAVFDKLEIFTKCCVVFFALLYLSAYSFLQRSFTPQILHPEQYCIFGFTDYWVYFYSVD